MWDNIPVNPLPGVETNGSLIDWSMVPSWVAGCRLLAIWIHTGYRVTDRLVNGSRLISLPLSQNPMRCLVSVSMPHTWEPELSELQMCVFLMWVSWHVMGGLVAWVRMVAGYGSLVSTGCWVWIIGFDEH